MHQDAETFIGMQQSEETKKAYRKDLTRYFNWAASHKWANTGDLGSITMEDALAFRLHVDSLGLAPASGARLWSTVRSYIRFLVVSGQTKSNPFDYIKGPKKVKNQTPKVPSDADVARLVSESGADPQRRLIIALLLNGLRASEVAGLKADDVQVLDGTTVILKVVGKGLKERLVPATTETQQAMSSYAYWATGKRLASAYVVSDFNGLPLTLRQVEHAVYKTAEYAGIEGMHAHSLRHHYATRLIRAGASPLHVRDLLGHASVSTTQVYVTLNMTDLIEASNLDPRNLAPGTYNVVVSDVKVA